MSQTTVVEKRSRVTSTSASPPPQAPLSCPVPSHITLSLLRRSLPASVFDISLAWSSFYLVRDYAIIALLYAVREALFSMGALATLVWIAATGFMFWCLFVVGHDAGHGTFSRSRTINFVAGLIAHTPIAVPFTGWQRSHHLHHQHHNDVDHDHSWRPLNRSDYATFVEPNTLNAKFTTFLRLGYGMLVLYPIYLFQEASPLASGNHFNPWSRLFDGVDVRTRVEAFISSVCVFLFFASLIVYKAHDPSFLVFAVLGPLIVFWCWLDVVTYLHHTHTESHYYRGKEWSYLKGALTTIDRNYGYIIEHMHHNIGTHMIHHLFFTSIPHYRLVEASAALHACLREQGADHLVKIDRTPILKALHQTLTECRYVDDQGPVVMYKNHADFLNEKAQ